MEKVKVYIVETRKKSYLAVGISAKNVKKYIEENKRDLDLSFDMSGYYRVKLDNDTWVKSYDMCDEYVDVVNLTNNQGNDLSPKFTTDEAEYNLILDKSLRV